MGNSLVVNKDKLQEYFRRVGSVDTVRNIAFEGGAQYQAALDNQEYEKLQLENELLKKAVENLTAQLEQLQNSKPQRVAKKKSK